MRGWLASVDLDADDRPPIEQAADHAREIATRPTAEHLELARATAERTGEPVEAIMVRLQQASDPRMVIMAQLRFIAQRYGARLDQHAATWVTGYRTAAQQAQLLSDHLTPIRAAALRVVPLDQQGTPSGPGSMFRGYVVQEPGHVEPVVTADDLMGVGIVTGDDEESAPRPQPSRHDLRARVRADRAGQEARMRRQVSPPPGPRGARRRYQR